MPMFYLAKKSNKKKLKKKSTTRIYLIDKYGLFRIIDWYGLHLHSKKHIKMWINTKQTYS